MSDYICCLYGDAGGYGVVTKIASVRNGINNFLAGYIPAENMRFRAEELTFQVSAASEQFEGEGTGGRSVLGTVEYPGMSKTLVGSSSPCGMGMSVLHSSGVSEDHTFLNLCGDARMRLAVCKRRVRALVRMQTSCRRRA